MYSGGTALTELSNTIWPEGAKALRSCSKQLRVAVYAEAHRQVNTNVPQELVCLRAAVYEWTFRERQYERKLGHAARKYIASKQVVLTAATVTPGSRDTPWQELSQ